MPYVMALVTLLGLAELQAQARPLDPPRPCTRAAEAPIAVDTTLDHRDGTTSTWLRPVGRGGPLYPVAQRNGRIPGEVRVSFTVDTMGRIVRGTADVVAESDRAFGQAVCEFLRRMRFAPMVKDGQRWTVRVTNQRFMFETGG